MTGLYAEVDEDEDPLALARPVRPKTKYGICSGCLERHRISMDGTVRNHSDPRANKLGHCPGGHKRPLAKGTLDEQKADALKSALAARDSGVRQARAAFDAARRQFDRSCEVAEDTYQRQVNGIEQRFVEIATKVCALYEVAGPPPIHLSITFTPKE